MSDREMVVRFAGGVLALAVIFIVTFHPVPQPLNTIILAGMGWTIGWQILKLGTAK